MTLPADPNLDPRIQYELTDVCPCGGRAHEGPVWGWGVCPDCGTWVSTRRPTVDSLGVVYGESYWTTTQELAGCPPLEARFESDLHDRVDAYLTALLPHLPSYAKVAEIGCGNGRLLHELHQRGFSVVGTEMLESVIHRVQRLTPIKILRGGAELFEPASLDALLSIDVLEHAHDPLVFLKEHARIVKPGGVMLVHTPVHEKPHEPYGYSVGLLWKLYHLYLFSRPLLERLFEQAGLAIITAEPRVFGWPVYVLRKR